MLVVNSAGELEPNSTLIVPLVPLIGDGFYPVNIQALQSKVNKHAVFAGESLVGLASTILKNINPTSLLSNKEQRLAAMFQDTVHPFVWFMSNPEVSKPTNVDYIESSLLPKEWPVFLFSRFKNPEVIYKDVHHQKMLAFFRSEATYGSEGWLSAHQTFRIMEKKYKTAASQWFKKGSVGNLRHTNARLLAAKTKAYQDYRAAQKKSSTFRSVGIHLLISTAQVYRQCRVNGLALDSSRLNLNIVCVPYGKSFDEATSESSNAESGETYEEWVGEVKFFLSVDVQRSEGSVATCNDKTCTCPESCSSTLNLGFNSCRKWNLAYIEW